MPALEGPPFPLDIEQDSEWCWEPLDPAERCRVAVRSALWNGSKWFVEIEALEGAGRMWTGMKSRYELDWFIEAAVRIDQPRGASRKDGRRPLRIGDSAPAEPASGRPPSRYDGVRSPGKPR